MSEDALYLYAIVPSTESGASTGTGTGIDGRTVVRIDGGQAVSALAHRQDTTPFEGPDDDVRRWVLEHSEVVDRAWQRMGAVLPVSFNVIVAPAEVATADESLQRWLQENATALREKLARLEGHVELRVEVAVDIETATADDPEVAVDIETATADDPEVARLLAEMAEKPEGVQRLYRKKLATLRSDVTDRLADALYPEHRRAILQHAADVVENRRSRSDEATVPVLSLALLVAEADVEALGVELAEIRDSQPGIVVRFLGPWPTYSFADLPTGTPGSSE